PRIVLSLWLPSTTFTSSTERPAHRRDLHSFPTRRSSDLESIALRLASVAERMIDLRAVMTYAPDMGSHVSSNDAQLLHDRSEVEDRKSTRLNSSHVKSSYAVFCLKKKTMAMESAARAGWA